MRFIENMHRLDRLDQLIRLKATGNPRVLAKKLEVSERTVYNLLELLKQMGKDVAFDKSRRSYYYKCS